ncbi:hypothetical protein [Lacticaseibacillus sp. GG6-2]
MLILFDLGLAYWALSDWRKQSVAALPFDGWCLVIIGYQLSTGWPWWAPLGWWLAFSLLARCGWLGTADAWLIGVFASIFPLLSLLWVLLGACGTGIVHALVAQRRQLPWIPHLAFSAVVVQLLL